MSDEGIEMSLPKKWVLTRLENIAEIVLGQSPPSSTYNEHGEGLPFYQGKLEFGKIYPTPQKWCTEPKKAAEKGDVLISVRAPVGPTNVCPEKSCIGRGLAAVRGLGGIETFFILHLLRNYEKMIAGKGTGTTFSAISGGQLRGLQIPLPPLNEQHRIVTKVEELFSFLDAGVASLRKVQAQLKRYRQAVLKYAFEGKLTEEWRRTHRDQIEPAAIVLEKIKEERRHKLGRKYRELPQIDVVDLQELPYGWAKTRIGAICDLINGRAFKPIEWASDGLPIIRIQNLNDPDAIFNYCNFEVEEKYHVSDGQLLFAWSGTPETSFGAHIWNRGKAVLNQHIFKVMINEHFIDKTFLKHLLNRNIMEYVGKAHGTAGLAHITKGKFETSFILLPSFYEQRKIADEIETKFSISDQIERVIDTSLLQMERLRQSILKTAFEGKLVAQDPADEPADRLLERIKAERAKAKGEKAINKKKVEPKQVELTGYVK